jgi:peptidoglycan/xylan/chitin deacetylase (PgdA/CDA1 family)
VIAALPAERRFPEMTGNDGSVEAAAMKHPTTRGISALRSGALFMIIAASSLAVPAATLAADAPGSCASATTRPANTWLSDTIASSTDVDWFRFTTTSAAWTLVTLGHLPADYDLSLYSGCSPLIATSHRSGKAYDETYNYLPAGTYRVKVVGYAGASSSTSAYALRFRPLAWGLPILSSSTWTDSAGYLHVVGEVLNNTADNRRWIEIDATHFNAAGQVVGTAVGYTTIATLAPRARSPFEIRSRLPVGYQRTTLRICTPSAAGCASGQVTTAPIRGLAVTPKASYLDSRGSRHYPGTIRNANTTTAYLTSAATTLYDTYGTVRGLGRGATNPSTVAAGGSASFDVTGSGAASPNRVGYAAQARGTGCSSGPRYATAGQENIVPPITRASASGRVALTFDMGGRMTPAVTILNTLIANRVCATIFPTGAISKTAEGQAALAIIAAHPDLFELGNHTMHHCDLVRGGGGSPSAADATYCTSLAPSPTEAEVKKELIDGQFWIKNYSGMNTQPIWRAPYGSYNSTVLTWAAQAGWTKHVKWDVDTIDWKPVKDGGPTARSMTLKVVNNAKSGSVVLMHLGGYETPDALQAMIDGLRGRGYVLTTLSDMLQ